MPGSGIRYIIFEISGKPSFVLWRVTQFFYLLCSQFRQKASGWINKTLLLIKQQKWLSEFCVKIDRVGRVTVNTHIFFFALVDFYSAGSLSHNPWADMEILYWFQVYQLITILVFGLTQPGCWGEHINHHTTNVFQFVWPFILNEMSDVINFLLQFFLLCTN